MSDRSELFAKFALLFSGLALFIALVYSEAETEKEPVDPKPSPSPSQTAPSQELTPKE